MLSILYLRCIGIIAVGEDFAFPEATFNSLFEMPQGEAGVPAVPKGAFNSLFEMHYIDDEIMWPEFGADFQFSI